jgi:8-oxo-dGTP pyrophosphatase MutT (NUDIX family)
MAEILTILTPRPAATVLTMRDGPSGVEVLMLRRNLNSDFVGGAYVFPGGGVDPADASQLAEEISVGLDDATCSKQLGLARGGLAYYVACLRELFEEGGLLIACDDQGHEVDTANTSLVDRLNDERESVNDGSLDFLEMLQREGLHLDLRHIAYFAHWVTPVGPPRRYDTRFFVALAPRGQVAWHDDHETVATRWLRPRNALDLATRGEFDILFPTQRNLEAIADFASANDVLDYARSLDNIARIEPRFIERDGQTVIVIAGDPGYDEL